jgi:hypothetical protein
MERYKSIYTEAKIKAKLDYKVDKKRGVITLFGEVLKTFEDNYLDMSKKEIEEIQEIDASKLQWGNTLEPILWVDAVSNTPSGYRLPTMQELLSASKQDIKGFKDKEYFSINAKKGLGGKFAWTVKFGEFNGIGLTSIYEISRYVRYVKK